MPRGRVAPVLSNVPHGKACRLMGFYWTIVGVMLLLGSVQLAVGVVLGRCLPFARRHTRREHDQREAAMELDRRRLRFFAKQLGMLAARVSGEVGDHRNQISEVGRQLADIQQDDPATLNDFVLRSVARLVAINQRLQAGLASAEERLQQQNEQIAAHFTESRTDSLTSLMNRRAFDDALRFQDQQATSPFALIMLDVDHFKELNDEYGHPAGDEVLCSISARLKALLAGKGMVARYGGEEFAAIVPGVDAFQAKQIAHRLRIAIASSPFYYEQTRILLSVSLGATLVIQGRDAATAVKHADGALYMAKRSGRNCAYFHDGVACRRIELEGEPSWSPVLNGASSPAPAVWADKQPPDASESDDSLDGIFADLRQRMAEVAGTTQRPKSQQPFT